MPIGTPVQLGVNATIGGVSTITITTLADSPAGNLIVVFVSSGDVGKGVTGVTDSAGNTYSPGTEIQQSTAVDVRPFWSPNSAHLPLGGNITATYNSATVSNYNEVGAVSVSGVASGLPLDAQAAGTAGIGTSPNISTPMLAQPKEIVFGFVGIDGPTTDSFTEAVGFTSNTLAAVGGATNGVLRSAYAIVSSTAAVTYAPVNSAVRSYAANILSFKSAANNSLTVNVADVQAVQDVRGVGKRLNLVDAGVITVLKRGPKTLSVSNAEVASLFKAYVRVPKIVSAEVTQAVRAVQKVISAASTQFQGLLNGVIKRLGVTEAQIASSSSPHLRPTLVSIGETQAVGLTRFFPRTIAPIADAQSVAVIKKTLKLIGVSIAQTDSILSIFVNGRRFLVTDPQTIHIARSSARFFSVVSANIVHLRRIVAPALSVVTAQAVKVLRALARGVGLVDPQEVDTVNTGRKLISARDGQLIALSRLAGRLVHVSTPQVVQIGRFAARVISAASSQTVRVARTTVKLLGSTVGQSVALVTSLTRAIRAAVANFQAVAVLRNAGRHLSTSLAESVFETWKHVKLVAAGTSGGQVAHVARSTLKLIGVLSAQSLNIPRAIVRMIFVAEPEIAAASHTTAQRASAVDSQVVSVTPQKAHTVSTALSQVVRIGFGYFKRRRMAIFLPRSRNFPH